MTAAGGVTYGYDNNGNQTSRGSDTFAYDAANRLTQAVIAGTTTTYTYNGDSVRSRKRVGNQTTDYVVDTNRSLPVVLYDGDAYYLYGLDLIARITTSGNPAQRQRYYHYDGLGSTRALTDANGNTSATYNYDVFGAIRSSTGNITNDFRYTGEQLDGETSYYFLRARSYDPAVGRFITRDPFPFSDEMPQSLNRYVYVANNPINRDDPSGLTEEVLRGLIILFAPGQWERFQEALSRRLMIIDRSVKGGTGSRLLHLDYEPSWKPNPGWHFNADIGPLKKYTHMPVGQALRGMIADAGAAAFSRVAPVTRVLDPIPLPIVVIPEGMKDLFTGGQADPTQSYSY